MVSSAYIHIPFCKKICSYCDFCKIYYDKKWINKYLDSLEKEIKKRYKNEILKTIYIGGGTPSSLDIAELEKLFQIINNLKKDKEYEYTIECNLDSLTKEKVDLFFKYGINRISIGIETFNGKYLKLLNRDLVNLDLINYIKEIGINNINVDLIYAINGQTIQELKDDLEQILKLDVPHISTYSLMIEPHTVLYNKNMDYIDDNKDLEMYKLISKTLKEYGYNHYEISNFAKENYESKHNLTYWNNLEYYGFGMGASGYINSIRYTNTGSIIKYTSNNYEYINEELTTKDKMENEMILGLRKLKGINKKLFKEKYNIDIKDVFDINDLIKEGKLIENDDYIYINKEYIYVSNSILVNFIGD